ncbi:hypothetical protein Hanom_Chr05g00442171 [Helianthus anomalus]
MPDSIEHGIASEVHQTIDVEVLGIQTESLVAVNESRGVKDAHLDIWDYMFMLDSVKPCINIVLVDDSKGDYMVETNEHDVVDSVVIRSFAWKPGWIENNVQGPEHLTLLLVHNHDQWTIKPTYMIFVPMIEAITSSLKTSTKQLFVVANGKSIPDLDCYR